MRDLRYDRICRTSRSEAYLISRGEEPVARIELHFTHAIVYGLLILEKEFDEEEITDLIKRVDDDLVWSADVPREDFRVTVYQGQMLGMYTAPARLEDDEDEEEEGAREGAE